MTEEYRNDLNPVLVELTKKLIANLNIQWPPNITNEMRTVFQQGKITLLQSLQNQGVSLSQEEVDQYIQGQISVAFGNAQNARSKSFESQESLTIIEIDPVS